jgi:chromosome partitioning protein
VLASRIGQRVIFADAARTGRLAGELEEAGPATREIMSLAAEVVRIAR